MLPQASSAVAPGSVKLVWHSTLIVLDPISVITGVGPARVIGPETGVLIGVPSVRVPVSTPLVTARLHPETVAVPPWLFCRPPVTEPPETSNRLVARLSRPPPVSEPREMDSVLLSQSTALVTEPPEIVPAPPTSYTP